MLDYTYTIQDKEIFVIQLKAWISLNIPDRMGVARNISSHRPLETSLESCLTFAC